MVVIEVTLTLSVAIYTTGCPSLCQSSAFIQAQDCIELQWGTLLGGRLMNGCPIVGDLFTNLLSCDSAVHHRLETDAVYSVVNSSAWDIDIWKIGVINTLSPQGFPTELVNCTGYGGQGNL